MRNVFSTPVRNVVLATIVGSFVATAALVSAAPSRPILRPESAVRPNAVSTTSATDLYAGGATLPAIAYEGSIATTTNPGVSTNAAVAGSAFQYFAKVVSPNHSTKPDVISYCQTGSGFGKKILAGEDVTVTPAVALSAANPCPALGTSPTDANGFGAKGQTYADFTGSDAPLSQTEFSAVGTYSKRGQAVQIPVIAGAIAMFYNNPDVKAGTSITDATLCNIAAGKYTNWNQLPGLSLPSRALTFVYRSDGSGTSFSFSNHLHTVCTALTNKFGVSQNFKYSSASDVGAFPQPAGTSTTATPSPVVPANFVGASGNPGIVSTVTANSGDIGYTEAANANGAVNSSKGINFLLLNGENPISNLPAALKTLGNISALVNMAIPAPTAYGSQPAPVALSGASGNCVLTVNPASYANLYTSSNGAYGLLAVTNLEFHSTMNTATEATDLQDLATMFYTSGDFATGKITTINAVGTAGTTGFSTLSASTTTLGKQVATAVKCIGA